MILKIDGVDMVPYLKYGGLKWQRSDVDSSKAGRVMDGTLQRQRVSTKVRLDAECRPLKKDEVKIVLNAIFPVWVTVEYDDPMYGTVTKTMYSNNNPATFLKKDRDGTEWWHDVTFPLIER